MKKLIMCKGLIASGKTTRAKEMVNERPGQFKRVNKDDLRAMLDCGRYSKSNEDMVLLVRDYIIALSFEQGKHVIVDDTNLDPKHEERLKVLAMLSNAKFEIVEFNTPLDECILRDSKRQNPIGEEAIRSMYNRYLKKEVSKIEYNKELVDIVICDIDGTLADNSGRSPYEQERVLEDKIIQPTRNLLCRLKKEYHIIITTGRTEACRKDTEEWLYTHGIHYIKLLMRAEGDNRKDSIVKKEMYENNIKGNFNVEFVIDDRPQVVDMWRSLGLFVFDVNQTGSRF